MAIYLADSNKSITFAPDDESQKRQVARHRVFFDAIHSRTRKLERSLIRNPQNPQSPKLPLYKEILQILPKLRKNERRTKQTRLFFLPSASKLRVVSAKLRKNKNYFVPFLTKTTKALCLGNKNKRVCFVFRSTFRTFAP
ncbi:MAG: hypothetical protein IJ544_00385 [Prevotella sp.]|nr:hypothetical protein [Prevotella sp.]